MRTLPSVLCLIALVAGIPGAVAQSGNGSQPIPSNYRPASPIVYTGSLGSTYVPMDSWVYPALDRLHSMGYLDTAFMGMRPWTRLSIVHMLQETADKIDDNPDDTQAREIYLALMDEFQSDEDALNTQRSTSASLDSVYSVLRGITDTPLNDSFHLGQTIVNDYGRPYQEGFNNYTGFSGRAEAGRFTLYLRGEYQHAPSAAGYTLPMSMDISQNIDFIPFATNPVQAIIPMGPIASANNFRLMEATISYHLLGHEISFGKSDQWLGPGLGGSMAWSTNAQAPYAFEINRVEPLRVPLLSRLTGPFRYEFFVGSLKGHTMPNSPWVHMEKISLKPTRNLEFGFERTVVWGGHGHGCLSSSGVIVTCTEPITLHTFLKSFFSFQNVNASEKYSRLDPGARFGSFDFDYRLPFLRNWVTLYADSEAHDDVSPASAPRRSAWRPGVYISRFPGLQHLDLRVEGVETSPVSNGGAYGNFLFNETEQRQGTTNQGFLFTDAIGRDAKGGQSWLTYHLSPREDAQFSYRYVKVDQKFIPSGTTQNDYQFAVRKRFMTDFEARGWVQYERWVAPFYKPGVQHDTTVQAQITWFPKLQK
ncbi:MAG TPA: capsule assembly Wzi family protein [Acidobacteriaceae bacterium]|nr:capsule assembly Wzi family protein [Acidobacteriaceae bacterium]